MDTGEPLPQRRRPGKPDDMQHETKKADSVVELKHGSREGHAESKDLNQQQTAAQADKVEENAEFDEENEWFPGRKGESEVGSACPRCAHHLATKLIVLYAG
jgi:hypothetical protein